eukprot:TRINITY_DN31138_c0_g1_i1.p1 TRINITY_DN31138_c0_g1~~TRINITY_DN31138_c0_g1_i1.p1  ORF type:complete len:163 (-),score=17.11 TRINITY_DN31138_c0_g1_i1:170-658(-)
MPDEAKYDDAPFTYYNPNPLAKKHFQAQCVGPNHSRKVTAQLSRVGHSFSEANLQVLKEDAAARKHMAQRYSEMMGSSYSALPWVHSGHPAATRPAADRATKDLLFSESTAAPIASSSFPESPSHRAASLAGPEAAPRNGVKRPTGIRAAGPSCRVQSNDAP